MKGRATGVRVLRLKYILEYSFAKVTTSTSPDLASLLVQQVPQRHFQCLVQIARMEYIRYALEVRMKMQTVMECALMKTSQCFIPRAVGLSQPAILNSVAILALLRSFEGVCFRVPF